MDSFEVENFRSLKHLKLEKLARVNLLVGKNNSGKTSVLEALFALLGLGSTHGFSVIEDERGLDKEKADFRYLFYNFDINNAINLSVTHRENGSSDVSSDNDFSVDITNSEFQGINGREILSPAIRKLAAKELIIRAQFSYSTQPVQFKVTRGDFGALSITPTPAQLIKEFGDKLYFPASARHATSEILTTNVDRRILSQKLEALKINKADASLLKTMQNIDSRIESIELVADGQVYLDLGSRFSTLMPLNLMGEGIQRLLDISSAIANVPGGIVLIDEIDNGLHYSALRILWKGILQAAREYDVQVFATTHSAEALRHLTWVLDDEENASYRADVAAYTLVRADDDTVRSYRHDYEQLEYAIEHGIEVRN